MGALQAFAVVSQAEAAVTELLSALDFIGATPLELRWPMLGAVVAHARHPASPVRIAVLRCLAGASGLPAERAVLQALAEGEPAVRQAAVAALPGLLPGQPAAWLHALASPQDDVRRAAAEQMPDEQQRVWIRLLADPASRAVVVARLERGLRPEACLALVQHIAEGDVDAAWAAGLLTTLPWAEDLAGLLSAMGAARSIRAASLGGDSTGDLAASLLATTDVLDRVVGLLLGAGADERGPAWRVFDGVLDQLFARELNPAAGCQLAASVLAVLFGGELRPHPVALAFAAAHHPALLGWAELPLSLRREAASALARLSHRPGGQARLEQMGGSSLVTGSDGPLLPVVCGLVALGQPGTLSALVDAVGLDAMCAAVVSHPVLGAILLRRGYEGTDAAESERLLRLAIERQGEAGRLLGRLLVHAPTRTLAALARNTCAALLAPAVAEADGLLATRGNGPGEAADLAQGLVSRIDRPVRVLSRVLREHSASSVLVQWLVVKVLSVTAPHAVVASLHTAGMERLAALDLEHQLLPASVVLPFVQATARLRSPAVRTWLGPVSPPEPDPMLRVPPPEPRGPVSEALASRIEHAPEDRLDAVIEGALAAPRTGLVAALARREPPERAHPRVCAALLLSDDALDGVAHQVDRFSRRDPTALRDLDRLMAAAFSRRSAIGLAAVIWLHRWPGPQRVLHELARAEGALLDLLRSSLSWQGAALRVAAWQAARSVITRWRWRQPDLLRALATDPLVELLVHALHDAGAPGRGPLGFPASVDDAAGLRLAASEMLAALRAAGRTLPWRPSTRARPHITLRPPPVADLPTLVERCTDAAELVLLLRTHAAGVAELAALRLLELEEPGAQALVDAIIDGGPHLGLLSNAVAQLGEGAALERARQAAGDPRASADSRFALATGLTERGEERWDDQIAAVLAGATVRPEDIGRIFPPGRPHEPLALRLWAAADPAVCGRAVTVLASRLSDYLDQTPPWERDPDDPRVAALRGFLALGADRERSLRLVAAEALLAAGDPVGVPLLVAQAMIDARSRQGEQGRSWAQGLSEPQLVAMTRAALVAGDELAPTRTVVTGLLEHHVDRFGREPAALEILRDCRDPDEQSRVAPLLWLQQGRMVGTQRIAELFVWGRRQSRRLLGRALGVEMLAGKDLGWTRLDEPVIRVNPLPLLRGERDGAAVVRGLLVHELGHHLYNADPEGLECARQAHEGGLGRLHNLVCDEHLERNLRTLDAGYGDDLKRLGAWAFQHANRRVRADTLVARLGPRAVPILMRSGLSAARQPGCVSVGLGRLLSALEAHGSSFGRFVRALRMGLGDRYGDPRVAEALALFRADGEGRPFRDLDNPGLLRITRQLRHIFGDESGILDICGLHGTAEPGEGEILADGSGVSARDVQREVERSERSEARKQQGEGGGRRRGGGPDVLSSAPGTRFERIERVKLLPFDPAAHRVLAQDVLRPARKLREVLARLGLDTVSVRPRVSGHRLDRSRLSALALRGDPRVLVARKRVIDSDLFIGVVVDCSGSMSGGRMERARRFAALLAEACRGLPGVDLRLFGFTDRVIYDAGTAVRCAAHGLIASGGNNDAAGLHHAASAAQRSKRSARLLIMISDGLPTECTVASLTNLVQQLERRHGLACAQVAVHPLRQRCFTDYIEVLSSDVGVAVRDFGRVVQRLVLRTMRR